MEPEQQAHAQSQCQETTVNITNEAPESDLALVDGADDVTLDLGGAVSPAVNVGDIDLGIAESVEVLPDTMDSIVSAPLVNESLTNIDIADLGGATVLSDVADVNDTADVDSLVSALSGQTDTGLLIDLLSCDSDGESGSHDSDGGSGVTDTDVGALISKLTGTVDGLTGLADGVDLSNIGAIACADSVTDIADPILDGLCTEVNLLDIADVGSLLGDHA
jgi:hypothetical protein